MGRGDYVVTRGSVTLDGVELLGRPTWERAARGLFLAMQYPVEVPGVRGEDLVTVAHMVDGEVVGGVTYSVGPRRASRT